MKILKTEKLAEGQAGALRARIPGATEVLIDERGKLSARVTAYVPDGQGAYVQHQVVLSDGEIERLLACLANPKNEEVSGVVGKFMGENLRNLLRLSALGAGTALAD
ncbi:hypothetical protein RE432_16275 [Pusillimonas sp. SM2304]|uniref:hypothetical protein n=1 Tax=Pusillimonas sp. SM2304 TaxID=3073241 RepID=UPI0028750723|nr:hypothetical protein [Pusillimonas sp. SM2304]MDS1142000.1 hypothetical protein [Pusillimonas sp. SM2304]